MLLEYFSNVRSVAKNILFSRKFSRFSQNQTLNVLSLDVESSRWGKLMSDVDQRRCSCQPTDYNSTEFEDTTITLHLSMSIENSFLDLACNECI